jgi:16S rRNA U1498 N3-methylase RsmE
MERTVHNISHNYLMIANELVIFTFMRLYVSDSQNNKLTKEKKYLFSNLEQSGREHIGRYHTFHFITLESISKK